MRELTPAAFPADLPALTSFRALLALGVALFHYHLLWAWTDAEVTGLFERARLGLDAFFILVATAIEAAGKKPGKDIIVVSVDGTRDALQAIVAGTMGATVECNPKFGPKAYETMERYARGEAIEPWVINEDRFFDKGNAQQLIADSY